ncbi:unnamed protein product [Xylocopa violacea]|uniref:Up-regulated during skeletal muscle growth protein 5 n=1 Tax=Xylocopa violacea TaxID=135666 RepID=A0ABP1P3U7_XYLVO
MAGEEEKLTGFSKYYNSVTTQGRVNVALTSLGVLVIAGAYVWFKPKKEKAATN